MKVRMLFEPGYEEVEALTVVDILRRAKIECLMVACNDEDTVTGSHNITVKMDEKISGLDGDADMLVLPGGLVGVNHLKADETVAALVKQQYQRGGYVAAICAAPTALGAYGILKEKKATCYPGMEQELFCQQALTEKVVVDGKLITSRGLGTAIPFALKLVEILVNEETARDLAKKIVYEY